MAVLTFFCPMTGRVIPSGIETDQDTLSRICAVSIRLRCPHCGGHHDVRMTQGYLASAPLRVHGPALARQPALSTPQHLSLIHISEPTRLGMISYAVFCL